MQNRAVKFVNLFALVSSVLVLTGKAVVAELNDKYAETRCLIDITTASLLYDIGAMELETPSYANWGSARFFYSDLQVKIGRQDEDEAYQHRRFIEAVSKDTALLISETASPKNYEIAKRRASLCYSELSPSWAE